MRTTVETLRTAVVPLVLFTSRRDLMGVLVNHRATTMVGWACATVIVVLNVLLIYLLIYTTLGGTIPGLS
jgi:Mn2+/Fe2+ NRAMP family transporter